MSEYGCKETPCTRCAHREVCSFKDEFLTAQKAVDDVLVEKPTKYESSSDKNIGCSILLRDIPYIKPVELACTYYLQIQAINIR